MPEVARREPEASLLHRGLGRAEFFDLATEGLESLAGTLASLADEGRPRFSFHAPIIRPDYFPFTGETCFFLNEDPGRRALSLRLLTDTLVEARRWGAEYVVTHLTYGATDTLDRGTARRLAREACGRMATVSRDFSVPIDVEFAAYSPAFDRPEDFIEAVVPHPELGICLDVGHAFLGTERRNADYLEHIGALAPRARSMHLWNTKGMDHNKRHGRAPLHPSQDPAEGWIDLERVLEVVLESNDAVRIIFEYPVAKVTPEVQAGYDWVAELVSRYRTGKTEDAVS